MLSSNDDALQVMDWSHMCRYLGVSYKLWLKVNILHVQGVFYVCCVFSEIIQTNFLIFFLKHQKPLIKQGYRFAKS